MNTSEGPAVATLDRDGFDIAYETTGPANGPAILFTHGYAATRQMWATTVGALSDHFRCITWDLRGHGDSAAPDDPDRYSPDLALADIEALLDACGVDHAILVGHSLGGYLSLRFQQRHPERVSALLLVGTGPGYRNDAARSAWNTMCEDYARGFEANGLDALGIGSPEVAEASHRTATGLIHVARRVLTQHDAAVIDRLPSISVPTLVIVGSKDRLFLSGCEYMTRKIPGARHVVIDGAGHAPMLTHPEPFQREVLTFLTSNAGAVRR